MCEGASGLVALSTFIRVYVTGPHRPANPAGTIFHDDDDDRGKLCNPFGGYTMFGGEVCHRSI